MDFQRITYTSDPIKIPDDFLTSPLTRPVNVHPIDFASSALPEYGHAIAFVLENVLSEEECKQLLVLAEQSVPLTEHNNANGEAPSPWRPALVSVGPGLEGSAPGYRESDRIIWDGQEVMDRIWERCKLGEGVWESMKELKGTSRRWVFKRGNERLRFLKYRKGQYFKPHCDAPYYDDFSKKECRTFFTLHLYLNDSAEARAAPAADKTGGEASEAPELRGGATAFLSGDERRRLDVNPRTGSVLIFQHSGLYHEGAVVDSGVKYTMRTDLLYELQEDSEEEEEEEGL